MTTPAKSASVSANRKQNNFVTASKSFLSNNFCNFPVIPLVESGICITFASTFQVRDVEFLVIEWKVGRVIDRAGLEIRYTPFGYRGFESLTFRLKKETVMVSFFSFFSPPYDFRRSDFMLSANPSVSADKPCAACERPCLVSGAHARASNPYPQQSQPSSHVPA